MKKLLACDEAKGRYEEYIKYLKEEELSERTIKKYGADVSQWLKYMNGNISKEDILNYINFVNSIEIKIC